MDCHPEAADWVREVLSVWVKTGAKGNLRGLYGILCAEPFNVRQGYTTFKDWLYKEPLFQQTRERGNGRTS